MNLNKTQSGEKTVFTLTGRLDTATAPQLQAALIPEFNTAKEVALDFSELIYVSPRGCACC